MRRRRNTAAVTASLLLMAGACLTALTATAAGAAPAELHDDFNGDGYPDLVVGAPSATVGGQRAAGYVAVLYGSESGISTSRRTVLSQNSANVPGAAEPGDAFGQAVAGGDFDGDGFADLAVGIPGEDVGTVPDHGGVTVLWGSADGLTGESIWLQEDEVRPDQGFGKALATGTNFIDGGGTGLAVLATSGVWEIDNLGRATTLKTRHEPAPERAREVGAVSTGLVAGNFNGDTYTDVIQLGLYTGDRDGEGWSVFYEGGVDGLQPRYDFDGGPVGAAGDIDKDGYADLVTGEPMPPGEEQQGGRVEVWYGGIGGPKDEPDSDPQVWTQNSPGVPGVAETGDHFGTDLSLGDVNGDGYADLAVGSDGEDIGTVKDAGGVALLRGGRNGLTGTGAQGFDQNTAGVPGTAEALDRFGGQVRLIDANRDGRAGLIAAAPGENTFDGVAWLLNGTTGGLTTSGSFTFGGGSLNAPSADAQFGFSLAE